MKEIGNSLDFGARIYDSRLGRWLSLDPLAAKYPSISPYSFVGNSPIVSYDPDGRDIFVTAKNGGHLFTLNDGQTKVTKMNAQQLYKRGIQWFEPLADNYMPLKSTGDALKGDAVKHFSWQQIADFSNQGRLMTDYRSGGSGDWKKSKDGADGYLLVAVDDQPYWADAIGQIPFAVNSVKREMRRTGNYDISIKNTIISGQEHGEGQMFGGEPDESNKYDNYMILRGALYGARSNIIGALRGFRHQLIKKNYSTNNLKKSSIYGEAKKYGVSKKFEE